MKTKKSINSDKYMILKKCLAFVLSGVITVPSLITDYHEQPQRISAAERSVTYGDVNSDGKINIVDMISLKSYVTENNSKGFSVKAADLDGDGKVSAKDAVELSMYLLSKTGSFSYEMNIDTDGDGLCDYVEKEILRTDYNKKDTDGDGLDDYSEVYICNTDPLNSDTDNTGVIDSLKDTDGDKLTNAEEIKLGTSPVLADTDNDEISDYDEVKGNNKDKYISDPLKIDSDGDGISDFGELQLGLNPMKPKSDGSTSDAEKSIPQKVNADSDVLKRINTEDNPYLFSLSADSEGFIEEILRVSVSDYSAFLMEDEIFGSIVDIECYEGYSIKNLSINFELKSVTNINDYLIFKYSDENGILLPTKTQYKGNSIYLENCTPGTYCVANIAEMAQYYSEENEVETVELLSDDMVVKSTSNNISVLYEIPINNNCTVSSWSQIESAMCKTATRLKNNNKSFNFTLVFTAFGYSVSINCTSYDEVKAVCDTATNFFNDSSIKSSNDAYRVYTENRSKKLPVWKDLSPASTGFSDVSFYNSGFVIVSFNGTGSLVRKYIPVSSGGLYTSISSLNISKYTKMYYNTLIKYSSGSLDEKIYQILVYDNSVTLKYPCRMSLFGKKLLLSMIASGSKNDSDGDGNSDYSEIIGTYPLSSLIKSSADSAIDSTVFLSKVNSTLGSNINADSINVTTMKSDPTKMDSDEDGIPDSSDQYPKKAEYKKIDDKLLDDSMIFDEGYVKVTSKNLSNDVTLNSNEGEKPNPYINYYNKKYVKYRNSYPSKYEIKPVSNSDYRITVDTALNDNCDVYVFENNFLWNDEEIKSTITDDEDKYIKDEALNVKHNNYQYILEAGKTYRIEVVVCSLDNRRDCYDVKVEQDNWVYAPNGGVSFSEKIYNADINLIYPQKNYIKLYLPEKILSEKLKILNFEYKDDPYFNEQFVFAMEKRMFTDKTKAEKLTMDISNFAGTISTYGGLVLLLVAPEAELAGIIFTSVGSVATTVSLVSSNEADKTKFKTLLQESTQNGNYNLCLTRYDTLTTHLEWDSWSKQPYIFKYNKDEVRYSITKTYEIENINDFGV